MSVQLRAVILFEILATIWILRTRPALLRSGLRRWECESPHRAETPHAAADTHRHQAPALSSAAQVPIKFIKSRGLPAPLPLQPPPNCWKLFIFRSPHMISAPGHLGDLGTWSRKFHRGHVCVVCGGLSVLGVTLVKLFHINWESLKYNQTINICSAPWWQEAGVSLTYIGQF